LLFLIFLIHTPLLNSATKVAEVRRVMNYLEKDISPNTASLRKRCDLFSPLLKNANSVIPITGIVDFLL
jgi:hypothetical protein